MSCYLPLRPTLHCFLFRKSVQVRSTVVCIPQGALIFSIKAISISWKKTKQLCDYLIVGVSTDELIIQSKGRPPLIPFEERISILESNRYVDEVIPQVDKNKQKVVDEYRIDAISVGSDWKGKYPSVTCEMVYFDYTPNVSSTVLKRKL